MDLEIDVKRNRFILKDEKIFRHFSRRKHSVEVMLNDHILNTVKGIELSFIRNNKSLIYFKTDLEVLSEDNINTIKSRLEHAIIEIMRIFDKDEDYWYSKFINE
jgi:hypothetical protein